MYQKYRRKSTKAANVYNDTEGNGELESSLAYLICKQTIYKLDRVL